uniref:Rho family GTPase 1 n=1 Tax=Taeniopygia guttata TaxID=59729 RepID=A0A674H768_TAEGU
RAVRQDGHAAGAGQGLLPRGEPRPAPGTGSGHRQAGPGADALGAPLQTYVPTVFENYTACLASEEQRVELSLWDTSGSPYYDNVRPLCYSDSDAVLLCFDVSRPETLDSAAKKWKSEILDYCPNTRVLLIGCKTDLRTDLSTLLELSHQKQAPISYEQVCLALGVSWCFGAQFGVSWCLWDGFGVSQFLWDGFGGGPGVCGAQFGVSQCLWDGFGGVPLSVGCIWGCPSGSGALSLWLWGCQGGFLGLSHWLWGGCGAVPLAVGLSQWFGAQFGAVPVGFRAVLVGLGAVPLSVGCIWGCPSGCGAVPVGFRAVPLSVGCIWGCPTVCGVYLGLSLWLWGCPSGF